MVSKISHFIFPQAHRSSERLFELAPSDGEKT